MSYTLRPYLVDLARLWAIAGSGNAALLAELRQKYADRLRFKSGVEPSPVADALGRIIDGRIEDDTRFAPRYAAALELLCDHFGEQLDNEMYQDTHGGYTEEVAAVEELLNTGPPLPIPYTGDFPVVGHFGVAEAREAVTGLDRLDEHTEPVVERGREQFRDWLEAAVREGKDLVAFYA